MGRKRKQRSTAIRKRIEKKQREDEKARRKAAKASGSDDETMLLASVPRASAVVCARALGDLSQRLDAGPIRGWTPDDLAGDYGLAWLGDALHEAAETQQEEPLVLEVSLNAQGHLLDRLSALEMAAPGLQMEWEEGFPALARAISKAEEPPSEDDEEDEDS